MKKPTKLQEILYQKRIKQVEIAALLKIEPSRISLFVNGIRPIPKKHLAKIAKFLNVSEDLIA